jgi:branched-chain amino acid transport system substrate-binding protein
MSGAATRRGADETGGHERPAGSRLTDDDRLSVDDESFGGLSHYLKGVAATASDDTDTVAKWMRENAVDDFLARGAKIREDGKLVHDFYLFQVKKKSDVKEPWDYCDVLRRVPPDEAFLPLSESECPLVKASR